MSKLLDRLEELKAERDEIEATIQGCMANIQCEGDCYTIDELCGTIEQIDEQIAALREDARRFHRPPYPEDYLPNTLTEVL